MLACRKLAGGGRVVARGMLGVAKNRVLSGGRRWQKAALLSARPKKMFQAYAETKEAPLRAGQTGAELEQLRRDFAHEMDACTHHRSKLLS